VSRCTKSRADVDGGSDATLTRPELGVPKLGTMNPQFAGRRAVQYSCKMLTAYLMDHERIRGLDRGMLHQEASAVTAEGRPESAGGTGRHRAVVR
jgi:hypothetical protein